MTTGFRLDPKYTMRKLVLRRDDHTNIIIWFIAILCAILAVAVIITGLLVIIIYLIYKPRIPFLYVNNAHLNKLLYDQSGLLDTAMDLSITAENDNHKANATFSEFSIKILFHGIELAELRADPFGLEKNSSIVLDYEVMSATVPLDEAGMNEMEGSLRRETIKFELEGKARTRWRMGLIMSVKFWTHLSCGIHFYVGNGSAYGLDCSSKSHTL